ncbi:unnamed protein product [Linum trigynum]|uniref:Uncharacterized protein n=1 Tax=Linum trigynum TaxID=586398 RepID=A0AAV2CXZ6_9ROSI
MSWIRRKGAGSMAGAGRRRSSFDGESWVRRDGLGSSAIALAGFVTLRRTCVRRRELERDDSLVEFRRSRQPI